jgi:DNA adenine methylase
VKTPLTYYGGKQRLASQIVGLMPPHRMYLEPFAGGAAVLFEKPRVERETINDLDGAVTAFWRVLRDDPDGLARAVAATPYSRREWEVCKATVDQSVADDLELARALLVTIDQSYARGGDTWSPPSKLGDRPARWQPGTWANMPSKLALATDRLRRVAVENTDAVAMLPKWDVHDALIYCDPPYTGDSRLRGPGRSSGGARGYRHDVTPDLWPRLAEGLLQIEQASVLLSGYPCVETALLEEQGWSAVSLSARRSSQNQPGRGGSVAPETVWLSPGMAKPVETLFGPLSEAGRAA